MKSRLLDFGVALLMVVAMPGCSMLPATPDAAPMTYRLEASARAPADVGVESQSIYLAPVRAAPPHHTTAMLYQRNAHQTAAFNNSAWIAPPANMLDPILIGSVAAVPGLGPVLAGVQVAPADLRLDAELLRLDQDFAGNAAMATVAIRVQLTALAQRRTLAATTLSAQIPIGNESAEAGVDALNRALSDVLAQLQDFLSGNLPGAPAS